MSLFFSLLLRLLFWLFVISFGFFTIFFMISAIDNKALELSSFVHFFLQIGGLILCFSISMFVGRLRHTGELLALQLSGHSRRFLIPLVLFIGLLWGGALVGLNATKNEIKPTWESHPDGFYHRESNSVWYQGIKVKSFSLSTQNPQGRTGSIHEAAAQLAGCGLFSVALVDFHLKRASLLFLGGALGATWCISTVLFSQMAVMGMIPNWIAGWLGIALAGLVIVSKRFL